MLTKAAVLVTALQGTQRQVRLTATVALLDAALAPQAPEPLMIPCPVTDYNQTDDEATDPVDKVSLGINLDSQLHELYARTCWGASNNW